MMKKRFTSLLVVFVMILQMFALSAPVAVLANPLTWQDEGIPATAFDGGSGSVDDPYNIATEVQLAYLAQQVNAGNWYDGQYFVLTNDLDLSGREWTPIGIIGSSSIFKGNFDGRGHVITGLTINSTGSNQGLFGYIAPGRTVERLGLTNVNINISGSGTRWGALAALSGGTISNSFVTGNLTSTSTGWHLGGLVGGTESSGIIKNSYTNLTVNGKNSVGGVVGLNYGSIINSFAAGTTTATPPTTNYIGGLVGFLNGGSVSKGYYTDYPPVLTGSGYDSGPITDGQIPAGNADVTGNDVNWIETVEGNPFQVTGFFTFAANWDAVAPWDFATVWTTNGDTTYPQLIPVVDEVASGDATVATVGEKYNIDNGANTIVADQTEITTNVTVGIFLGNLTKNAGASWKVASSGTSVTDAAEFLAAGAKADGDNLAVGDQLAVLAEDGTTLKVYDIAVSTVTLPVFNNDKIRIGDGNAPSVNNKGNLLQPFYYDTTLTNWYELTYSSNPLDNAIGVGGDGTNEWNSAGTIAANPILSSQVIDVSGYTSTAANKGYGTIVSTGDVSIGGKTLEVKNTYTLGQDKSFIKIVSRITNKSGSEATNLRFWVGTQDDWVGTSDTPTKKRGNLVNGQFAAIENAADRASALQISSAATGVLFYSTSEKAHTAVADGLGFATVYGQNPATAPIELTGDSSYALYVRMNDLADEEYEEFTWYYAAGELANLGSVAEEVAEDSGPEATAPDAPTAVSASAGNGQAVVSFTAPANDGGAAITSYTVYSNPGNITATGAGSPITVTGLTNGTAYTFTVKATNSVGDSPASDPSSAVAPLTVPGAPTAVSASAGNGQAVVSFTAPADNGGAAITSYTVYSNPGNITATGAGSQITLIGLTNGTTYTFTVKATNSVGDSPASAPSSAVTPAAPRSGGGLTPSPSGIEVIVNGKTETAGTENKTTEEGRSVVKLDVNEDIISRKIDQVLAEQKDNPNADNIVEVPVKSSDADKIAVGLTGDIVKKMDDNNFKLNVKSGLVSYVLPANEINITKISKEMKLDDKLKDIEIEVQIEKPTASQLQEISKSAQAKDYEIVFPPVIFEVKAKSASTNQEISIDKFDNYVERLLEIPAGMDPNKITTGIVYNKDGTFSHVPTEVFKKGDKYYAKLNSLTNSTYSVIWHPLTLADVANHWSKEAVNDMGSRLVVTGVGDNKFEPDRDITRAEFAAIVVRGLGLMRPGTGRDTFGDVQKDTWYYDAVSIAYQYQIIKGYDDGKFRPEQKISRQEAMAMIARAMKIAKLETVMSSGIIEEQLAKFTDKADVSDWAKENVTACLKNGIVVGYNEKVLPKNNITRAETATMVQRMLQKANLINK